MSVKVINYPSTDIHQRQWFKKRKKDQSDLCRVIKKDQSDVCRVIKNQCESVKRVKNEQSKTYRRPKNSSQTPNNNPKCSNVNSRIEDVTKLYLVLDLDHTLLNSTKLDDLESDEEYIKNSEFMKGSLFRLDDIGYFTKLRPYVHRLLEEANKLFELCVYTMAGRAYALKMANLLDPENQYFKGRIFSNENCTQKYTKGLDVMNIPENFVLVLDDTEVVWQRHKKNLILMDKYCYFASSCRHFWMKNCKSLCQIMRDEDEFDGALNTILSVIKKIHSNFFGNPLFSSVRDVRQVLETMRKQVLKDTKIVFSADFSTTIDPASHPLWKMAEDMGAKCLNGVDSSATHVVAAYVDTEESIWAEQEGKFLVNQWWIEAAYVLWRRQIEDFYPVNQRKQVET